MNPIRPLLAACLLMGLTHSVAADVDSGLAEKVEIPALTVRVAAGEASGKELNLAEERGKKPTVYVFIRGDQWSRPMARFLKGLDDEAKKAGEAAVVNVWLTDDPNSLLTQLPRVQESLKFQASTLAVYEKGQSGPNAWAIHGDAHATVIVAHQGKAIRSFGFVSVNETLVADVVKALKKAMDPGE